MQAPGRRSTLRRRGVGSAFPRVATGQMATLDGAATEEIGALSPVLATPLSVEATVYRTGRCQRQGALPASLVSAPCS